MSHISPAAIHRMARFAPARAMAAAPALGPARAIGSRTVHFIDIENLCGKADLKIYEARAAMRRYHETVGIAMGDHVIIGASHHNAVAAGSAWPGARLLPPRSGPDGADLALREAMLAENFGARFDTAYLGSGDGGFANELAFLASNGMTTHVVSHRGAISRRLRLSAHHTTILPDFIAGLKEPS